MQRYSCLVSSVSSENQSFARTCKTLALTVRLSRPFDPQPATEKTCVDLQTSPASSTYRNALIGSKFASNQDAQLGKRKTSLAGCSLDQDSKRLKRSQTSGSLDKDVGEWVRSRQAAVHAQACVDSVDEQRQQQQRLQELLMQQIKQQHEQQQLTQLILQQQLQLKMLQQQLLKQEQKKAKKLKKQRKSNLEDLQAYLKTSSICGRIMEKQKMNKKPQQVIVQQAQSPQAPIEQLQPAPQLPEEQAEWTHFLGDNSKQISEHPATDTAEAVQEGQSNGQSWFPGNFAAEPNKDWEEDVNWELLAEGEPEKIEGAQSQINPPSAETAPTCEAEGQQHQRPQIEQQGSECPVLKDLGMCQEGASAYSRENMYLQSPAPACMVSNSAEYEGGSSTASILSPFCSSIGLFAHASLPGHLELLNDDDLTR
jgi:hypothetical protein